MRRSALGVVTWLVVLNALVKPAWLLAENSVQNYFGHQRFGSFAAAWQLTYICSVLLDVGTTLVITQLSAQTHGKAQDPLLRNAIGLRLMLALLYVLCVPLIALALGYKGHDLKLVLLLASYHLLQNTLVMTRGIHQGQQRFYLDGILGVADKLLLLAVIFLVVLHASPSNLLYGMWAVLTVALTLGASFIAWIRLGPWVLPRLNLPEMRGLLLRSLPFAAMATLVAFNERITTLAIERGVSAHAAGLYAAAYRWILAIQMYLWTVAPIFFARFARHMPTQGLEKDTLTHEFRQSMLLISVPVLFASAFCAIHPEILIALLKRSTASEQQVIADALRVLAVGIVPLALITPHGTFLSATGQAQSLARVLVLATVCHLGTLWCSLFLGQWLYAAVAYSFFQLVAAGLYYLVYFRQANLPTNIRLTLRCLLSYLAAISVLWLGARMAISPWLTVPVSGLLTLLVAVPLQEAKNLFSPKATF